MIPYIMSDIINIFNKIHRLPSKYIIINLFNFIISRNQYYKLSIFSDLIKKIN